MKKIYLLFATALTLGFTACEDIPAPYGINTEFGEKDKTIIFEESFKNSLGDFVNQTTDGAGAWVCDYSTAKASGYDNTSKETTAGTYYLVSPQISLKDISETYISYEYILRYNKGNDNQQVLISDDYTGDINTATWKLLNNIHTEGSDWETFETKEVNIPTEYMGKTVHIAFRYYTNATSGSTWEVRNLSIKTGVAENEEGEGDDDTEETPDDENIIFSESFATSLGEWVNNTTSGSGSWINDFKTAKASGYDNTTKVTTAGTYYLVSPEISLADVTEANISYEYILRYNKSDKNQQVFISTDYAGNAQTATWKLLNNQHTEGADWTTFEKKEINIPAEYMGKTVRIAFYYNTNATSGSTIEIRNFAIKQGNVEGGDVVTPDEPVVDNSPKTLPYTETFTSSLGAFKNVVATGGGEWINDFQTAKASNYNSATKETTVGTIYLVSPAIVLTNAKTAYISYESIIHYNKGDENQQLVISKDYNGDASTANWTIINQTHVSDQKTSEGKPDWKTFESISFAVPAEFLGENVYVAFRYNAEESGCSTWEVRNFAITETENIGGGDTPDTPDTPTEIGGLETFANGDFEEWNAGLPIHWKSTTTASKSTLTQSTDAHSGTYSVHIKGMEQENQRIAFKEMKLNAGTYTMTFFAKSASEGGSIRPGYVPLKDGKVGNYMYGEYVNDLTNTWIEVTHTFELTTETVLNLVIMNAGSKKIPGKDVLIDDFTIIKN